VDGPPRPPPFELNPSLRLSAAEDLAASTFGRLGEGLGRLGKPLQRVDALAMQLDDVQRAQAGDEAQVVVVVALPIALPPPAADVAAASVSSSRRPTSR
jgi:hypothetical protein